MDFQQAGSPSADRINRIIQVIDDSPESRESPGRLCTQLLSLLMHTLEAERGFIMLFDPSLGEMEAYATVNIDSDALLVTEPVSQTVLDKVVSSGRSIIIYDALDDSRFADKTSVVLSGLRSIVCVPILAKGGVLGIIYADNRTKSNAFKDEHSMFLKELSEKFSERITRFFPAFKPKPMKDSGRRLRDLW